MNKRVFNRMRRWLLGACAALVLAPAQAAESTALDTYLQGLNTWSADFTQEGQDARGRKLESSTGKLLIVRPGKFRWEIAPEGSDAPGQLTIADGRNLWLLDYDLEQATVKSQAEVLPQSPTMLLTGGADLRSAFKVSANGRREGLDWVRAEPAGTASDFREALFGFRGRELAKLVIIDKLGQRSTLTFRNVQRNISVDPALVRFELPRGVDLIGNPVAP